MNIEAVKFFFMLFARFSISSFLLHNKLFSDSIQYFFSAGDYHI